MADRVEPFPTQKVKEQDGRVLSGKDALQLFDNWFVVLETEIAGDYIEALRQELEKVGQDIVNAFAQGTLGATIEILLDRMIEIADANALRDRMQTAHDQYLEFLVFRYLSQSKGKRRYKRVYSRN